MENPHVQRLLEEDYEFKFGDYLSEGFRIFKENLGGFVVFTILMMMINIFAMFIPFIGSAASSLILTPALMAGFYIVANKVIRDENREFGDFFSGFNYVPQLALVVLMTSIITLLSLIPFGFSNVSLATWYMDMITNSSEIMTNPEAFMGEFPGFSIWTLVLLIPAIYFSVAYAWAQLFVVFHDLKFWDAMEASRIMISKKWFTFLLFNIVIGLIAGIGVIGFCIGMFFTVPIAYCMMFAAFADVTRLNEIGDDEVDLLDHLVEG